jgi:AcrR family transcriptional regulator
MTADARELLLGVAAETCAEFGWRDSTIDRLCERAGVSNRDFYATFDTMDDLFLEMYERHAAQMLRVTDQVLAEIATATPHVLDPVDAVDAIATAVGRTSGDRTWWILTTEYMLRAVRHPEIAERYRSVRQRTTRHLVDTVREALDATGPAGRRVDVEQLVELTMALHRGSLAPSFLEPGAMAPETMDRLVWPAILSAVSRPT